MVSVKIYSTLAKRSMHHKYDWVSEWPKFKCLIIRGKILVNFGYSHCPALCIPKSCSLTPQFPPSYFFCKIWNITLLVSSISTPSFLLLIFSVEIFEEEETERYKSRIWEYKEQDTERSKSRTLWVAKNTSIYPLRIRLWIF